MLSIEPVDDDCRDHHLFSVLEQPLEDRSMKPAPPVMSAITRPRPAFAEASAGRPCVHAAGCSDDALNIGVRRPGWSGRQQLPGARAATGHGCEGYAANAAVR